MEQGDGHFPPDEQLPEGQGFRDAWSRALRPSKQTPELARELDLLARRFVRQAHKLVPYIITTAKVVIVLFAGLLIVVAVAVAKDIFTWSGSLPSHGLRPTLPHLLAPLGVLGTLLGGTGVVWRSRRRRRHAGKGQRGGRHRKA